MNKQLLFLSLAAAALFAGCARNEIDGGGVSARQISATATGSESPESKAPLMGTSLNGQQAQIYTTTAPLEAYTGDKTKMFTDAYAAGTMTFADNRYTQYDAGFSGIALLPTDKSEVYLYGFYPLGWTSASGGSYESLSHTFDGKTDLMATWFSIDDQQKIAFQGGTSGTLPDKADFMFGHLLTRYNVQVKASDVDAQTRWGRIKSINLKNREIDKVSTGENLGYTYSAGGGAVSFYKLAGTPGAPTYSDDVFEQTAFANMPALTTSYQNACYTMAASVDVDANPATAELTLVVETLDADGGQQKLVEVPLSFDRAQLPATAIANNTCGSSITVALNFRAGLIEASAIIEAWKDGGEQTEPVQPFPPLRTNPPAASDYVTIDGLRWAKGNLVAKNMNECKVGAPADYGVYFQFGSLVGWTGGANGNGTGQGEPATVDKAVWPAAMGYPKPSYAWPSKDAENTATLADYYFNYSVAPWETDGQNIRDFAVAIDGDSGSGTLADGRYAALGVGDPCTYYLGAPWRTPTATEIKALFANAANGTAWSAVTGWNWQATPAGAIGPSSLFFPVSGLRGTLDGLIEYINSDGFGWSSSVYNTTSGRSLDVSIGEVYPQYSDNRSYGFPVRCVAPLTNPPAASDIVTIDGLQWTKGNLVAKNSNECKVGAPTDYGVYFQFGSLVGWTGGTGNGTGQGQPALDKAVWPLAMGTSKPSYAWPKKDAASTSTLSNYYFNYSVAPWETEGSNIRDFAVAISGDSGSGTLADGRYAKLGVGDPCTYYLGAPWRLPTTAEQASITGKTGSSQIAWATSGLTGRWVASGVSFDGVSGPGAWFGSPLSAGSGTPSSSVNPFFPASGYRDSSNGSFYVVTANGYYWSSSVYHATHGLNLGFLSSWVYPQGGSSRSFGFPVRCVASVP